MGDFDIKGLDEFQQKLKTVEKKAPDRILKEMDRQGNSLRRAMRGNTPRGKTGNLIKGYKTNPVKKTRGGYSKGLYNKAPHHHLVNNGHRKVSPSGKVLGWTPGLFYVEKTVSEQGGIIFSELQQWLAELYSELK